jgi:hypothetical protein
MAKKKAAEKWRIEDSFPPMLMVEFRPLMTRVMAELMMAAKVTCNEEWQVSRLGDEVAKFVIAQLREQTHPRRIEVPHWVTAEEE